MAEIVTQQNMRRDVNARDQFGRLWLMAVEKKTNQPCGGIDSAGWVDPLRTPQKYIKVQKDEFGQYNPSQLRVLDQEWIRDQHAAEMEWRRSMLQIAQEKMPGGFDIQTIEDNEWIVMLTGPRPWPSSAALTEAFVNKNMALLGKPGYVLGPKERALLNMETITDIEERLNDAAAPPADVPEAPDGLTWPQFVSFYSKYGKSVKECSDLYGPYKAKREGAGNG